MKGPAPGFLSLQLREEASPVTGRFVALGPDSEGSKAEGPKPPCREAEAGLGAGCEHSGPQFPQASSIRLPLFNLMSQGLPCFLSRLFRLHSCSLPTARNNCQDPIQAPAFVGKVRALSWKDVLRKRKTKQNRCEKVIFSKSRGPH